MKAVCGRLVTFDFTFNANYKFIPTQRALGNYVYYNFHTTAWKTNTLRLVKVHLDKHSRCTIISNEYFE